MGEPTANEELYLDWNATTPPHPRVLEAMQQAAARAWGNPSSVHAAGRQARAVVDECTEALAELAQVHPRDVLLTSGGTEANNLALHGAPAIVTSRLEHPSVLRMAERLEERRGRVEWLPVPTSGRIEPDAVAAALRELPAGAVVAVAAANHETGVLQPLRELAPLVHAHEGRLHVDAVQAAGKVQPEQWRHGDSLTLAAHKIRGPKGIGALAWKEGRAPQPLLVGGAQQRGLRAGTVDAVLAAGFRAAAQRAEQWPARYAPLAQLRDELEHWLLAGGQAGEAQLNAPQPTTAPPRRARLNGAREPRLPHVTNVSFDGWRGDELVAALDLAGVRVSSGSACSAGTSEPSAVIEAMLGHARAASAVRISLGETTTREQIERAISVLSRVLGVDFPGGSRIT